MDGLRHNPGCIRADRQRRQVLIGEQGATTIAGKFVIRLYLGKSAVASAYGAASSLVIVVVWVYYSAQILLFGAEFTKVWTRRRGGGAIPEKTAVPITQEARAEQGLGPRPAV